jgi:ABC-type Fe3+-hydroxamate transport system substrate-binding protein
VKTERIDALRPDLILANKEENVKEQIEGLAAKWPVWVSDINNLEQAIDMIRQTGQLTGKMKQADNLHHQIQTSFQSLTIKHKKPRTAYLIWKDPYMTIGRDTYIHSMLELAGFDNIFKDRSRYPETNLSELRSLNCEVLLLSSEPYPFREKHILELQEALPDTRIFLADGEMFSWYGSRLLKAPAYFQKLREKVK